VADSIVIVESDPRWPDEFERLRTRVAGAVGDVAVAIEHIGSTAVPGLAAKPVIDLVVVVEPTSPALHGGMAREPPGVEQVDVLRDGAQSLSCARSTLRSEHPAQSPARVFRNVP
jgi:GrpB-like predicted nucleotidyltransferase (UPF0157 family)